MIEALKYNLKHNRRNFMKQATAWFLFGAIIVVFIFWGLNPRMAGTSSLAEGGSAAVVNNSTISIAKFQEAVQRLSEDPQFAQLQALGGDVGQQILQQQAMQQLVQTELIRQQTEKQGILTSDAEVRDIITSIQAFQENGQFKRDRYMAYLQGTRKTAGEFETEIRNDQSMRRTVKMFGSALRPIPQEVALQKGLADKKTALEFLSIQTEALVAPESVPASDVKAFLADSANEPKIKEFYEASKDKYSTGEQVKARHILIKTTPGDESSQKQALAKIEDLAKRAKIEDFAKLAKEFSEDPGSKDNGGDLGFFGRGRMVKEFDEAAFATAPGQLSAPVKTEYGYHLIQVLEKKPAETRSLEQVREEIAKTLLARDHSQKRLESLQQAVKGGDLATVNKFASENKLKWSETGTFGIDAEAVPGIGPNDEVMRVAFTLSPEKSLATELVREGSTAYVLRYKSPSTAKKGTGPETENPELAAEIAAASRGQDAVGQWLQQLQKNSSIAINPRFQGGPQVQ